MENPIKMDAFEGKTHYFWKHPHPWKTNWENPQETLFCRNLFGLAVVDCATPCQRRAGRSTRGFSAAAPVGGGSDVFW